MPQPMPVDEPVTTTLFMCCPSLSERYSGRSSARRGGDSTARPSRLGLTSEGDELGWSMTVDAETIAFAHRLADAAGEVIRPYFRQRIEVDRQGRSSTAQPVFDPVTEADKDAEKAIRAIIERERPRRRNPRRGIRREDGHERPALGARSGRRHARLHQRPPRMGLADRAGGKRAAGARHHRPARASASASSAPTAHRFCTSRAASTPLHVRAVRAALRGRDPLRHASLRLFLSAGERAAFRRVSDAVRMSRWGGDCYIFGTAGAGLLRLIVESTFHRWDVAALIPVIEGAGGIITNWQGGICARGRADARRRRPRACTTRR